MKEFGSDFHYIPSPASSCKSIYDYFPYANFYANGRQALIHLYKSQGWTKLWVPEYYCYEVINTLRGAGLELDFYTDYPGSKRNFISLDLIQKNGFFSSSDAVLIVNYFGLRSCRKYNSWSVAAVVEDHTHDIIGGWACNSSADWCIASLRKTLPIPQGGILWSPKGLELPSPPSMSTENELAAATRWEAMELKRSYILGDNIDKAIFRASFINTELFFDKCDVCSIDVKSREYLSTFDIQSWYQRKIANWNILKEINLPGVHVLLPENADCNPFSLILIFDSIEKRDKYRIALIENRVYPAILWSIPVMVGKGAYVMSRKIISIHCDARYSIEDIQQLKLIIQKSFVF